MAITTGTRRRREGQIQLKGAAAICERRVITCEHQGPRTPGVPREGHGDVGSLRPVLPKTTDWCL